MKTETEKLVRRILRKHRRKCPYCGIKFYALHKEFCSTACKNKYYDNIAEEIESTGESYAV